MASQYLGDTIDIHGGGADLMFPHHDCEIAQTECATGQEPFVRFWMHTAMVEHEGEKMSKSLGNLVMVRDLLEEGWHPDALRLYMHSHHYRRHWAHDPAQLEKASQQARLLRQALTVKSGAGKPNSIRGPRNTFATAMEDDLDTPTAVAALEQFAHEILDAAQNGQNVAEAQDALRNMGAILGLHLDSEEPPQNVREGWDRHLAGFV